MVAVQSANRDRCHAPTNLYNLGREDESNCHDYIKTIGWGGGGFGRGIFPQTLSKWSPQNLYFAIVCNHYFSISQYFLLLSVPG